MATNMYKKYTESLVREWPVPADTQAGEIVQNAVSDEVGVTLTARGDSTRAAGIPGVTGGTVPNGGVGNKPNCATVAVDGSWLFEVTGVADGDTSAASGGGTANGTIVYLTGAGALTLTEGSNVAVAVIDDGVIVDGVAPIKIGAVL